ncbi:kinase-like protein [Aspergillus crustosus]
MTPGEDQGPTIEYSFVEDVERPEGYCPGGYHPLALGDLLASRYRVVHKLGYGAFSTIWLCADEQTKKYAAVKIGIGTSDHRESEILDRLNSSSNSNLGHRGRSLIPTISDQFTLRGPNGLHPCHVTAPAGCSLKDAIEASWKCLFQPRTARSLIVQLIMAVDYIHSRGIVHGVKFATYLHVGNILLRLPPSALTNLSTSQLYAKFNPPSHELIERVDGNPLPPNVPPTAIIPIWLGKPSEDIAPHEASLLLTDFGEAYSPSMEQRLESHTPLALAPPETIFEPSQPLSFSSDIWTMGCAIWVLLGTRPLFENFFATRYHVTTEQIDVIGPEDFPKEWWEKWDARHHLFDFEGPLPQSSDLIDPTSEQKSKPPIPKPKEGRYFSSCVDRFEKEIQEPRREAGIEEIGDEERRAIMEMLRSMLRFRPETRVTAAEVLECEWVVRWGMEDYRSACK